MKVNLHISIGGVYLPQGKMKLFRGVCFVRNKNLINAKIQTKKYPDSKKHRIIAVFSVYQLLDTIVVETKRIELSTLRMRTVRSPS